MIIKWLLIWFVGYVRPDYGELRRAYQYEVFLTTTTLLKCYDGLPEEGKNDSQIYKIDDSFEIKPVVIEKYKVEKSK